MNISSGDDVMKKLFVLIISMFLLISMQISIYAQVDEASMGDELGAQVLEELSRAYSIKRIAKEEQRDYISDFDISSDGKIAVLYENSIYSLKIDDSRKSVCVYDIDGKFLYGYLIKCPGAMEVKWTDDDLAVYDYRADVLSVLSENGNLLCAYNYSKAPDRSNEREYEGVLYKAHSISNSERYSYDKIAKVSEDGKETTIIAVKGNKAKLIYVVSIISLCTVVSVLIFTIWKRKRL